MSITIKDIDGGEIYCKSMQWNFQENGNMVMIGDKYITLHAFCNIVEYVLQNTDLIPNDPRSRLIKKIRFNKLIEGYNPNSQRIELG